MNNTLLELLGIFIELLAVLCENDSGSENPEPEPEDLISETKDSTPTQHRLPSLLPPLVVQERMIRD